MKRLYIARHAKSSWDHPNLEDFERPLNQRGMMDASFMGDFLVKKNIQFDLFISSPANRAISTAKIIAQKINYTEATIIENSSIYESSLKDLLQIIENIDNQHQSIILFGHNPSFSKLIDYLSGEYIGNLPTSGIAQLEFEMDDWKAISKDSGNLLSLWSPKGLK